MVERGAKYPRKPNDLYETPPEATRTLLALARFRHEVCDPCKGGGAILKVLRAHGFSANGDDIVKGYDFLTDPFKWKGSDIITNPPFGPGGRTAVLFVRRALQVTRPWKGKVAMLLPADFDSGKTRLPIFGDCREFDRKIILLNRVRWFNGVSGSSNHAWYVWKHNRSPGLPTVSYALQEFKR